MSGLDDEQTLVTSLFNRPANVHAQYKIMKHLNVLELVDKSAHVRPGRQLVVRYLGRRCRVKVVMSV